MAKITEKYELLYIIDATKTEEEIAAIATKFKDLIEGSATLLEVEEWGRKKLAYPIDDKPDGFYVLVRFSAEPDFPAELDRVLGITDGIMRSLLTVIAE
ncbi:MAG: 30S ribosomal protein S6 [Oscillospiraceae bacterium]|jgi:small subunit ribosomal protein S6|nr:30S ribosomal protein S6 [Oscillospiraceae bacterium]